jgi:hypothetical protein
MPDIDIQERAAVIRDKYKVKKVMCMPVFKK